ncbi:MAG: peptidase [Armatimonadetes bacterium]|nr:peptidase [Armatimonadota bacterium]
MPECRVFARPLAASIALLSSLAAWADVTSPKAFLGFDVCADYMLADYGQLSAYWKQLTNESDRIRLVSIGKTEEGRDQLMAVITDPMNARHLESHRRASARLALAEGFKSDAEAEAVAKKAKAVVWIDGGLHATETISTQSLIETAYRLVSAQDDETKRILRDCIVLLVHANPDGMDLVSKWYMRRAKPEERSLIGVPRLYQKYAGHDNNRDFYASNLAETRNINRVLYREWFPQIVYNHHQSAPAGTMMFVPPFRSPFNHNVDALTQISTDLVGTAIHQRLIAEGKPGSVMRSGANYSAWWNGGLRTTTYFHNMVGILTELWGSPNPAQVPFRPERQVPTSDLPLPVTPGLWHARQSLEYEITANLAVLDYASRQRQTLLMNIYRAGRNSIERGSKDTWTRYPSRIASEGAKALSDPKFRDARAYVVPSDQPDFATATKFVERLLMTGIKVERVTEARPGAPVGSFVVRTAQAFRPHVLDMFEPQDHPNDLQYPGGPPVRPYDNAGYTLAFQMGVRFERLTDAVELKTEPVGPTVKGSVPIAGSGRWLTASASQNDAFTFANAMDAAHVPVARAVNGAFAVPDNAEARRVVATLDWGRFEPTDAVADTSPYKRKRIGLWDTYGGSMDSGWLRYTLEKFRFDFRLLFAPEINGGSLSAKFDTVVFPSGAVPSTVRTATANPLLDDPTVPQEWKNLIGTMSQQGLDALKSFARDGGTIVAMGSSALPLAKHLGLPVENALEGVRDADFFVPGSVLRIRLDPASPLCKGLPEQLDVMFDESPAFRLKGDTGRAAWFDTETPLRSGWAWGQKKLKDADAVIDLPIGKGRVVLIGPEVNFRAQSDGAYKILFNALS